MRAIIATVALCLIAASSQAEITNNEALKGCLAINGYTPEKFDEFDFTKASYCFQNWRSQKDKEKLAELRDFLKHNPRYRVPGQSLNRCWGKPREMPFESVTASASSDGSWHVGVNYKDTIPAGCYENAPWDNRNVEN